MKAIACLRFLRTGGGEALAAFLGPNGAMSSLSGCVAKMAVVSDGTHAAQVLVLAPPKELLASDMTDYDWLSRWNRLRVYHGPDESTELANASECVERTLAQGLIEHVRGAKPSVVTAILKEAFGKKLAVWHEIQKTRRIDAEAVNKLEVLEVRDLEDEERERILAVVPTTWMGVVKNSGSPIHYGVECQTGSVPNTRGVRKKQALAAGLGVGAVLGGVLMSGLALHLYGFRKNCLCVNMLESHNSTTTPDNCTWSEAVIRALSDASSTLDDNAPVSATTTQNSITDIMKEATCKLRWPNIDDVTTLISESELAALRVPMAVCKKAYKFVEGWSPSSNELDTRKLVTEDGRSNEVLTTPMMPATTDGWRKLDWGRCYGNGGKIVCSEMSSYPHLRCHYYEHPYRYDFPTVWEAIVRYLKPSKCSFQCNNQERPILGGALNVSETRELLLSRFGAEIAGSIPGIDTHGLSGEQLQKLGLQVEMLMTKSKPCSHWEMQAKPPYRAHVALPGCNCTSAKLSCFVETPLKGRTYWGSVGDLHTVEEALTQYYTAFKRPGHVVTDCGFECFQPVSDMTEQLLKYWKDNGLP
ncbi:putative transmembrane protein [Gregarina niphandrodes]|uniref:Transmembrane protein n=1 Tax=Gregarina niphandrodes TaxID=110365 RepID=A0A023B248_GRENI|nr:putative transmembrane protein [Gregarina niphandrodes]EZG51265.1 putative transmembrane protein [Gregarina niphandrodes]|eukprot:XP_011131983.1 putative transmembrane protein [Gregarina niphandrodes]